MAQDVGYGMMLSQPDGTLAEPSRTHTRRGQRLGDPGLANAELISWRETAATLADKLGSSPVEWLDEAMPVERP